MSTVLVTEADSNLGERLAVGLADAGHQVVAASRSGDLPRSGALGLGIIPLEMDLLDRSSVAAGVAAAADLLPSLDVVVANGVVGTFAPLEQVRPEDMSELLGHNLIGQLQLVQAAIPHLRRSERARIVGITSIAAMIGLPGGAISCAARAGFEAALDALRHELSPFAIRVSTIQAAPADEREYNLPPSSLADGSGIGDGYDALRRSVSHFGCHVEDPDTVVKVLRKVLAAEHPAFRYTLGVYADMVRELRRAEPHPELTRRSWFDRSPWRWWLQRPGQRGDRPHSPQVSGQGRWWPRWGGTSRPTYQR
jgi:NAD(P)-dependent dehydrogenase (short-subunit alcohol dehydrogenase family)